MSTDTIAPAHVVTTRLRAAAIAAWLGATAGGVAGLLSGGVGGRLAMFLLRLTSPSSVDGRNSDDGFEIGKFSFATLGLLALTTLLGMLLGLVYVLVGRAVPRRWRIPLWTLALGTMGAAALLHADGIDFNLLVPHGLAVALFTAIPLLGAWLCAMFVERWEPWWPHPARRAWWRCGVVLAAMAIAAPALAIFLVLLTVAVVAIGLVSAIRPFRRLWRAVTPVLVTVGLVAVSGLSLWALRNDVVGIL